MKLKLELHKMMKMIKVEIKILLNPTKLDNYKLDKISLKIKDAVEQIIIFLFSF
jgi:hypothetical protein